MAQKSACVQYRCKFCFSEYFDPQLIESKEKEATDTEMDGTTFCPLAKSLCMLSIDEMPRLDGEFTHEKVKGRKDPDWLGLLVKLLVKGEVHPT